MRNTVAVELDEIHPIAAQEQQGRVEPDHFRQRAADQCQRTLRLVGLQQITRQRQQYAQLGRS